METPTSALHPMTNRPIVGVFDSGVGGLSVLKALCVWMPQAQFVYLADSGHAPYGERTDEYVLNRSRRITQHLLEKNQCAGIVIACNTATAVAVQQLRALWPGVPLVGVEPGVKPAVAASRNKRIGVMATTATLRHARFHALVQAHAATAEVIAQPCPGLALAIERGELRSTEVQGLLDQFCGQLRDKEVDTVVLGCTHYAFVHDQIAVRLGAEVRIIDTAEAVSKQAARLMNTMVPEPVAANSLRLQVELNTTGQAQQLQHIAQSWLRIRQPAQQIEI